MLIVIHADADRAIGTGHVVRSLALATALRDQGDDAILASARLPDELRARAEAAGVAVVDRTDAPRTADAVVVDGYHLGPEERRGLAEPSVPRVVLDDLAGAVPDAEIVVNQNLYASPAGPTRPLDGELLAGPHYALLGSEYVDAPGPRAERPAVERILVTMGGSDPHDATGLAVRALAELEGSNTIRVVIGAGHPHPDGVARPAAAAGWEVVRTAPSLAPHLAWADLAVSGCGTTVLELARLGVPMVGVVLADNQERVAEGVAREGIGVIAGRHPGLSAGALREAVDGLRRDPDARAAMALRGPQLVDGHGAARVAAAIRSGPLRLRPAAYEDADRLLAWRNDPVARAASFDTGIVEPETHRAWLADALASPRHRMRIGLVGGAPVGVVRFTIDDDGATVSVAMASDRRGAGLGTRLIATGCTELAADAAARHVDAWIRPENTASIAAFRAAGFRVAEEAADRLRYRLDLEPVT